MTRKPLDRELVSRSLVADISEARRVIDDQRVLIDGTFASKPSTNVSPKNNLVILPVGREYVSRGGIKLEGALKDLQVEVQGKRCLDAGAGTGGFTQCLLKHEASEVTAVDVGYGLLDWKLRSDHRVRVVERTNIRMADLEALGGPYDLVVADLSFISLELVSGKLSELTASTGALLVLVKPQFEAPPSDVGEGGIVFDPAVWTRALERVAGAFVAEGMGISGVVPSRLKGAEGNQEFFILASRGVVTPGDRLIARAVLSAGS